MSKIYLKILIFSYFLGEKVNFYTYGDPHLAAAILKKFLRELKEPLMTFDLFEPITRLHCEFCFASLGEVFAYCYH